MSRPASAAVAGYYPTPAHLLPAIANLIDAIPAFEGRAAYSGAASLSYGSYLLADPCAGDGAALVELARQLFLGEKAKSEKESLANFNSYARHPDVLLMGCEMEQTRAQALQRNLQKELGGQNGYNYHALHADAFTLGWETDRRKGANVLYLNPPYDFDSLHGRLEQRFLERFTELLISGEGILVLVVPHYALAASAEYLAQHYEEIQVYRFPHQDFEVFKQVVVIARRVSQVVELAASQSYNSGHHPIARRLQEWASDATQMPVLPTPSVAGSGESDDKPGAAPQRVSLVAHSQGGLDKVYAARLDHAALAKAARPWCVGMAQAGVYPLLKRTEPTEATPQKEGKTFASSLQPLSELGLEYSLSEFVGQPFPVAMPPKPAHIAMALASGVFNGKRLDPNPAAPLSVPSILAKGVFKRELQTVEEKRNKAGEVTGLVQIQQPELVVTVLSLFDYRYYEIWPGTQPSGQTDLARMNVADLLVYYSQSLARLMSAQFPALHHPANPLHQLSLPALARKPFTSQAQAVMAALKLLARGENPFFVAEVSTGKTTMTLTVAGALSQPHFAQTMAQLKKITLAACQNSHHPGQPNTHKLRVVKRALVLCPPHLPSTWQEEAAAVLPGAKVVIVSSFADIDLAPAPELAEAQREAASPQPGAGLTLYILSREMAKLGHALAGGAATVGAGKGPGERVLVCPRCGRPTREDMERLAQGRTRCQHSAVVRSRPLNEAAALANLLADLLVTAYPEEMAVASLTPGRYMAALRRKASAALVAGPDKSQSIEEARCQNWERRALLASSGAGGGTGGEERPASDTAYSRVVRRLARLVLTTYHQEQGASSYSESLNQLFTALIRLILAAAPEVSGPLASELAEQLYSATLSGQPRKRAATFWATVCAVKRSNCCWWPWWPVGRRLPSLLLMQLPSLITRTILAS